MTQQESKKILKKVRLINWQYFENETVNLKGSTLISGENTTGKTTILDAIQLVLTTNTQKFNLAANENSSRNIKGYVRCKLGEDSQNYLREGTVISNVALEFFDENKNSYFTLGIHIISKDEDSTPDIAWYTTDCDFDSITFLTDNRPSLRKELLADGKEISFLKTKYEAQEKFRFKLGNLDARFSGMIQKAIAFKPMKNVKEFINNFLLAESNVKIDDLKSNIERVHELENLLNQLNHQKKMLETILQKYEEIKKNQFDANVAEFLVLLATIENLKNEENEKSQTIKSGEYEVELLNKKINELENKKDEIENLISDLNYELRNNEVGKALEEAKRKAVSIQKEISEEKVRKNELNKNLLSLKNFLEVLKDSYELPISVDEYKILGEKFDLTEKSKIIEKLNSFIKNEGSKIDERAFEERIKVRNLESEQNEILIKIQNLEKQNLQYPIQTVELKQKIEQEFKNRGIESEVNILCDLLEIKNDFKNWTNVVEGYLHTQKFYLIVEPKYFPIALEVYNRNSKKIHSAGLINTRKIFENKIENYEETLAFAIETENSNAKKFIDFILGKVIRCDNVQDLENYKIAVTSNGMLYQNFVVSNINPKRYENPFIGQNAYKIQLENARRLFESKKIEIAATKENLKKVEEIKTKKDSCKIDLIKIYMDCPNIIDEKEKMLLEKNEFIKEASKNQGLLDIQIRFDNAESQKNAILKEIRESNSKLTQSKAILMALEENLIEITKKLTEKNAEFDSKKEEKISELKEAEEKFIQNKKNRTAKEIAENFSPMIAKYKNYEAKFLDEMKNLQFDFNKNAQMDFKIGLEEIDRYIEQERKLEKVLIVNQKDALEKMKKQSEEIFRADFLSKMKELIESAKKQFIELNKVLEKLSYGEDRYKFTITFNKRKESLYKMIMSDLNQNGEMNLWSNSFESEFQDEINELYEKLLASDDAEDKIVREYTDYRNYLDFDIKITKTTGAELTYSKIAGEKSGAETQVPFYVAIAASFFSLYRYGSKIRIILFDEAFEKMDESRISTMMNFFKNLNLQVILVTPPEKIEIIRDSVESVIVTNRVGHESYATEMEY